MTKWVACPRWREQPPISLSNFLPLHSKMYMSGDVLAGSSEVGKIGHGTQPFRLSFQLSKSLTEPINNLLKGGCSHIGELLFAQVVPHMLYWIEFGTVGGLGDQANIVRDDEILGLMPSRLIDLHDQVVNDLRSERVLPSKVDICPEG